MDLVVGGLAQGLARGFQAKVARATFFKALLLDTKWGVLHKSTLLQEPRVGQSFRSSLVTCVMSPFKPRRWWAKHIEIKRLLGKVGANPSSLLRKS